MKKVLDKIVEDDFFVQNLLLKTANRGEAGGVVLKRVIKKNWKIISSIVTLIVLIPIYFIWGINKSRTPE